MARETWYWLMAGLGFGAVNTGDLLAAYPDGAEAVAADLGSARLDEILTQKQAERLAASRPEDFALRISHAESQGIYMLAFDEEDYPAMLRSIQNPPLVVFVKGDISLLNGQLSVGVVGARRPSAYGVEATKALGRGIALGGAIIVSGLAAGLDAEAHKAALAVNGPTIACIAFGHNHCYPAANRKLMEVIERYGAVVSEYPPDTGPEKPFFLQRNRIIAGLSHGVVVVEARRHSGTMSTVNFAADYGRDVFAVPGSIFSELSGGTNAIIREGAYLAGSASDVLAVYGIELTEEDPVKAASKQAAEGRPAAAMPPWQQSLRRYTERSRDEQAALRNREELPGQQSLGEVMRARLGETDGSRVSATQAIDAFRQLQQDMPADADSEIDARNAMLDEMVAAVSDNVQIGRGKKAPAARPEKSAAKKVQADGSVVEPYPWHKVEHLDKRDVEDLSASEPKGRKRKPKENKNAMASLLFGGRQDAAAEPRVSTAPVERVGAVGRIEPVERTAPVSGVYGAHRAQSTATVETAGRTPAPAQQKRAEVPVPVADRPRADEKKDEALADRLKTLNVPHIAKQEREAVSVDIGGEAPFRVEPSYELGQYPTKAERDAEDGFEAIRPDTLERAAPPPAAKAPQRPAGEDALGRQSALKSGGSFTTKERDESRSSVTRVPRPSPVGPATRAGALLAGGVPTAETSSGGDDLLSDIAHRAYRELGATPTSFADICERSGLSSAEAMAALTELELAGKSRQLAGRQFVIMQ